MSWFKRLFSKKEAPPADGAAPEEILAGEIELEDEPPPADPPVAEEPPLADPPQPTVESPALTPADLTFSAEPEPDPDPEPEPEEVTFLAEAPAEPEAVPVAEEEPPVADEPPPADSIAVEEPDAPITVARMNEAGALEVLERALDELGSAHHRPFSRG